MRISSGCKRSLRVTRARLASSRMRMRKRFLEGAQSVERFRNGLLGRARDDELLEGRHHHCSIWSNVPTALHGINEVPDPLNAASSWHVSGERDDPRGALHGALSAFARRGRQVGAQSSTNIHGRTA